MNKYKELWELNETDVFCFANDQFRVRFEVLKELDGAEEVELGVVGQPPLYNKANGDMVVIPLRSYFNESNKLILKTMFYSDDECVTRPDIESRLNSKQIRPATAIDFVLRKGMVSRLNHTHAYSLTSFGTKIWQKS